MATNEFFDWEDAIGGDDVQAWDGSGGFNPPAPGDYELKVQDYELGQSKKGDPMATITWEVMSNADGSETDQAGLTIRGWYTGKRAKHLFAVLGVPFRHSPSKVVGMKVLATVIADTYKKTDPFSGEEVMSPSAKILKERAAATSNGATRGRGATAAAAGSPRPQARRQ